MIITIDGPVASGKSTAARNLARALGFRHLDTGAIYRALTLLAGELKVDPADRKAVSAMLARAGVRLDGETVYVEARDVSAEIRRPDISSSVRFFAENPDVRAFVKDLEHRAAAGKDIVVEGRDMGTVVFPEAEVKIYLTASAEERARRRSEELEERGTPQDYRVVLAELMARDRADMTRPIAPLRKAPGAVEFDSTGLTQEESAARLLEIVRAALKGR
jgi:cytidylate kinase